MTEEVKLTEEQLKMLSDIVKIDKEMPIDYTPAIISMLINGNGGRL